MVKVKWYVYQTKRKYSKMVKGKWYMCIKLSINMVRWLK